MDTANTAQENTEKEEDILDFTKRKEATNVIKTQYLTFKMESETYGIKLTDNKEVIEPPRITNVPHTESYIMGVINLRGQIVPVLDLKKKLNLIEAKENKKNIEQKIIVVQIEETLVGIMVDEVHNVVGINEDNIEEINESRGGINQEFINGVFTLEKDLVIIIDIIDILFDKEENQNQKEANHA